MNEILPGRNLNIVGIFLDLSVPDNGNQVWISRVVSKSGMNFKFFGSSRSKKVNDSQFSFERDEILSGDNKSGSLLRSQSLSSLDKEKSVRNSEIFCKKVAASSGRPLSSAFFLEAEVSGHVVWPCCSKIRSR